MLVGPVVQRDLFSILAQFRTYQYVFTSDISKMYRQVLIAPEHRPFQKILWREDPSLDIQEFELNTATYGTAAASFLATRSLVQLVQDEGENFPLASRIVLEDFYIDDCLRGANSTEEAIECYHQLNQLMSRGGFQLRKWSTNCKELLDIIQENDQEIQDIHELVTDESYVRTLGVIWCPNSVCCLFNPM